MKIHKEPSTIFGPPSRYFRQSYGGLFVTTKPEFEEVVERGRLSIYTLADLSILKWKYITSIIGKTKAGIGDNGYNTCAFCRVFFTDDDCGHCPIALHTQEIVCRATPYPEYAFAVHKDNIDYLVLKQRAALMATYLMNLRTWIVDNWRP